MELSLLEGVALLLGFFKMGEAVCEWIIRQLGGKKDGNESNPKTECGYTVS